MKYDEGTPGWVVEGSSTHHAMTECAKLDEEKRQGERTASHAPFDSQKHTACTECTEVLKGIPQPPRS